MSGNALSRPRSAPDTSRPRRARGATLDPQAVMSTPDPSAQTTRNTRIHHSHMHVHVHVLCVMCRFMCMYSMTICTDYHVQEQAIAEPRTGLSSVKRPLLCSCSWGRDRGLCQLMALVVWLVICKSCPRSFLGSARLRSCTRIHPGSRRLRRSSRTGRPLSPRNRR